VNVVYNDKGGNFPPFLLGIGVLDEEFHLLEFAGMGAIFLGLIRIDGRALKWLTKYFSSRAFYLWLPAGPLITIIEQLIYNSLKQIHR
jgi:hypothetical protein